MNQIHAINEDAYSEWLEYRRLECKKKVGPIAEKKQRRLLANYPPNIQQYIIDTSINAGWQGLFPPKGMAISRPQSTRDVPLVESLRDRSWAE